MRVEKQGNGWHISGLKRALQFYAAKLFSKQIISCKMKRYKLEIWRKQYGCQGKGTEGTP